MKWLTASDIKNWANVRQRQCQEIMPELLRRLILAHTANNVTEINFPCGDSVTGGGWDGRLNTPVTSPFFPAGPSGWEIGTEKSAATKAESDYVKRTTDPLGFTKKETSFIFVTPRAWPGLTKWRNDKISTGVWKDVVVINADVLEQWLETAPAVSLWLARRIDKVIAPGVDDIESVWDEWSEGTKPQMTPELLIGGRTKDVEVIHNWLQKEASILEMQGDHPDEALNFVYAAISTFTENDRSQALARCVVVESIRELRQMTMAFQNFPLIIVAPGECIEAAPAAVNKGHHVYICVDAKVVGIGDVHQLGRPQSEAVEKILHAGGYSKAEAQKVARDYGRSIPVLRRRIFKANVISAPAWANAASAKILSPLLFAGAWDERNEGDRQVIEALSDMDYDSFIKDLIPFISIDDSPVRKIGTVWMLKSPLDAWFLLSKHLTDHDLQNFEKTIIAVLSKTNPKYDLEADKRWAAAVYGKSNPYSEWIRTGLVESLVLIAVYGDRSPHISSTQAFADYVVKNIFSGMNKWEAWASIKDVTPLLAEAAPNSFMVAVEESLKENPSLFQELMKDDNVNGMMGECKHSGLLWALENVSWSSEFFPRTVNILFELSKIDSGGTWGNRPISSLKDLFIAGLPQTHATPEERLAALERLIQKDPIQTWKFSQSYFSSGVVSESHRFRWRDTGGDRRGLEPESIENYNKYITSLLPMLADLACKRENLISAVDEFIRLPEYIREKILERLERLEVSSFTKEELNKINQCIREALNWINTYAEDGWEKEVPALYSALEKFTPDDVLEKVGWLLNNPWPRLPQGEPREYEEKQNVLTSARNEAAREVLDKVPLEKINEYAGTIQYVNILGSSLGRVVQSENEDSNILDFLIGHHVNENLIIGYAVGRIITLGNKWVEAQIERMKANGNYSPEICALLCLALPESSETWSAVNLRGKEVENAYWKKASGYSSENRVDDARMAVEKLLIANRPVVALQIAGNPGVSLPSELLRKLLDDLLSVQNKDIPGGGTMEIYYLGHVFNQLYERDELSLEDLTWIEWPYAPILEDLKQYIKFQPALHRLLQKDPAFFAMLMTFIYKRDDRSVEPRSEEEDKKAERRSYAARKVLDSWNLMPGIKEGGELDELVLTDWILEARKHCAESNHITGGDLQIASMLAHAPNDPDGNWPHVAVRNIIERLSSKLIEDHIEIEIYNSRGVTSRGRNEGGIQERALTEKYKKMSESLKAKWPRTAAMLRAISENYDRQAKREDVDSDLDDLRWG